MRESNMCHFQATAVSQSTVCQVLLPSALQLAMFWFMVPLSTYDLEWGWLRAESPVPLQWALGHDPAINSCYLKPLRLGGCVLLPQDLSQTDWCRRDSEKRQALSRSAQTMANGWWLTFPSKMPGDRSRGGGPGETASIRGTSLFPFY